VVDDGTVYAGIGADGRHLGGGRDTAEECDGMREQGVIYVDFDARTGHNHGTKFRIKSKNIPMLYAEAIKVV